MDVTCTLVLSLGLFWALWDTALLVAVKRMREVLHVKLIPAEITISSNMLLN